MALPLITIGIPAYGRGNYLREAIQSCLAQNYPRLEILVADDASPQDPWPHIADLQSERWNYVRHPKNLGGPGNFNYLIERASGEFFILHQDDDSLHPEFCRRASEALTEIKDAVLFSGLLLRGPEQKGILGLDLKTFTGPWLPLDYLRGEVHRVESLDALIMLLMSMPFMHPAVAMRRDVLLRSGGYYDRSMFASDNATFGRMLSHGPMLYDTRLSGFFRLHGSNNSSSTPLNEQYACRRSVAELLLPIIDGMRADWAPRLTELVGYAPRRERWKILAEALEADLPAKVIEGVVRSLGSKEKTNLLRARLFKARWFYQYRNWVRSQKA
jgi:glycosyltransferase involved in cell wall biosynthesis